MRAVDIVRIVPLNTLEQPKERLLPVESQLVSVQDDDERPWSLVLVYEYTGEDREPRWFQAFRSHSPIPEDARYLRSVVDGRGGPLHLYEVPQP